MQLPFEVLHVALKLIDALSERENVVAGRVVCAFPTSANRAILVHSCFNPLMFASAFGLVTWRAGVARNPARN